MSDRYEYADSNRLFTLPVDGTFPDVLPLPTAEDGSFSPDVKVPRENSNDFNPMWVGDKIYFLPDRGGEVGVWVYNTRTKKVSELVHGEELDIKSASATEDTLVYERFGSLYLADLKSGKSRHLDIQVPADLPEVRPHFEKMSVAKIENAALSPTGQRAVFETYGEILTVPAEKGNIRNLTSSPSVADWDPSWSPDGKNIAYFSDELGEQRTAHPQSERSGRGHQDQPG
jgi:tricorn protease